MCIYKSGFNVQKVRSISKKSFGRTNCQTTTDFICFNLQTTLLKEESSASAYILEEFADFLTYYYRKILSV